MMWACNKFGFFVGPCQEVNGPFVAQWDKALLAARSECPGPRKAVERAASVRSFIDPNVNLSQFSAGELWLKGSVSLELLVDTTHDYNSARCKTPQVSPGRKRWLMFVCFFPSDSVDMKRLAIGSRRLL